jgi:hypothetical protein
MATLFEFLDSINTGKGIELNEDDPFKEYVPFQVNNGLSQYLDTVMLANEMNKRPWLSKGMQYRFLVGVVSKKKRYGKWAKADAIDNQADIDLVSEFYQINKDHAKDYLKLLGYPELELIRQRSDKGGCNMPKGKAKK